MIYFVVLCVSVFGGGGGAERECCHHSPLTTLRDRVTGKTSPVNQIRCTYMMITYMMNFD